MRVEKISTATQPAPSGAHQRQVYPLVATAVIVLLGMIVPLAQSLELFQTGKIIQLLLFLGFGLAHTWQPAQRMQFTWKGQARDRHVLTTSIALTGGLILAIIYLAFGSSPLMIVAGSVALFALPELIRVHWSFLAAIPEQQFLPWVPPTDAPDKRATISINSITVYFRLRRDYFDLDTLNEPVTEPSRSTLGKAFHQFLDNYNQQNKPVTLTDEQGEAYSWTFTVRMLKGATTRYLDPGISLVDNKVANNSVITARRLRTKNQQQQTI